MITLALDTSTTVGSIAILQDDQLLAEETFTRDGLFPALEKLKHPQPDRIIVGVGPGSFTGIRAGIAAAKGLALPRKLPVIGVSSFDALALTALPQMPPDCELICVLTDARRGELYCAFYNRTGQRQGDIRIAQLESFADAVHAPIWFVSSDIEQFRATLRESLGGFALVCSEPIYPRAALLTGNSLPLEPLYLRETDYKKFGG
jgi:tRNA threonylcarbamoyladenosine biosynthesis protein TsaB